MHHLSYPLTWPFRKIYSLGKDPSPAALYKILAVAYVILAVLIWKISYKISTATVSSYKE